jgi:hypothetical protein
VFEGAKRSGAWGGWLLGVLVLGGAGLLWARPELGERLLDAADLAAAGVDPTASWSADERSDQPYAHSPLQLMLAMQAAWLEPSAAHDPAGALAFADELAEAVGRWLLVTTGTSSVQEAERALWEAGRADELAVFFATTLRERQVHARRSRRLSEAGFVEGQPVYVHPDELAWLFAHVAWRLDLRTELVQSPVHHYVVWREPEGERSRAVEATCFRRVDALGKVVPHEQPSVGRRLVLPEHHYPEGTGGIRNPDPLPEWAYRSLSDTELADGLARQLGERLGEPRNEELCATLAELGRTLAVCEEGS